MGELFIGMDCGGTRTRAVLGDGAARILARATAGPGNPCSAGQEVALRSHELAIDRVLRAAAVEPERVRGVCLGAAGAGRPLERRRIAAMLRTRLPNASATVESDAVIALFGATAGRPGIIAISGTGSIVIGAGEDGAIVRAGGWGWILGDEGSGSVLGREAVRAVFRSEDGRAPKTLLRAAVLDHFKVRTLETLISRIYRRPPPAREYARLWPRLLLASRHGDRVAREILRTGGVELADTVVAVASRLRFAGRVPLVLSGGVLSCDSPLRRSMLRRVRSAVPRVLLIPAVYPPVVGALLLATAGARRGMPAADAELPPALQRGLRASPRTRSG